MTALVVPGWAVTTIVLLVALTVWLAIDGWRQETAWRRDSDPCWCGDPAIGYQLDESGVTLLCLRHYIAAWERREIVGQEVGR